MGNETRWTSGPWETDSNDHDQPYLAYAIRPKKNQWWTICEVWQDDAPVPDYNAEQRANAHLIAAAPDGYALAELVMDYCGNPKGMSDQQRDELYEVALQFTKKARGEQA